MYMQIVLRLMNNLREMRKHERWTFRCRPAAGRNRPARDTAAHPGGLGPSAFPAKHKLRTVSAMQAHSSVVTMTGDGDLLPVASKHGRGAIGVHEQDIVGLVLILVIHAR